MEVNEDGTIQWIRIRKSWKPHFWMAIDQGIRYTAFLGQSTLCSGMFYLDLQDIVSSGSLVRISHSVLSIDTKINGKLTSSTGRFWTRASCNVWKPMSSSVGSQHDASWASSGKAFWWDMRYEGHIVKTWNVHQSDRAKPLAMPRWCANNPPFCIFYVSDQCFAFLPVDEKNCCCVAVKISQQEGQDRMIFISVTLKVPQP